MTTTVQKAPGNRAGGYPTKRMWFVPEDGSQVPTPRGEEIFSFASFNTNDRELVLSLDDQDRVWLTGSQPPQQRLSLAEACEFLAAMEYEAEDCGHGEAVEQFFRLLRDNLKA